MAQPGGQLSRAPSKMMFLDRCRYRFRIMRRERPHGVFLVNVCAAIVCMSNVRTSEQIRAAVGVAIEFLAG